MKNRFLYPKTNIIGTGYMEKMGARPVNESVEGVVGAATLEDDGPTGQFFRDKKRLRGSLQVK